MGVIRSESVRQRLAAAAAPPPLTFNERKISRNCVHGMQVVVVAVVIVVDVFVYGRSFGFGFRLCVNEVGKGRE